MRVVIEGVEWLEQRHTPLNLRCRLGQGIRFSKPFQAEQLDHLAQDPRKNLLKTAGRICSRPREPWPAKPPQREP
jgi:hypothetical protein